MSQSYQERSSVWGSLLPDSALSSSTEWGKFWMGIGRESSVPGLASLCSILSKCSETVGVHLPLHTAEYLPWRWKNSSTEYSWIRDELVKKSCMAPWHSGHWHDREIDICFFLKPLWFAVFLFVFYYPLAIDREYENTSFLTLLSAGIKPLDLW